MNYIEKALEEISKKGEYRYEYSGNSVYQNEYGYPSKERFYALKEAMAEKGYVCKTYPRNDNKTALAIFKKGK